MPMNKDTVLGGSLVSEHHLLLTADRRAHPICGIQTGTLGTVPAMYAQNARVFRVY